LQTALDGVAQQKLADLERRHLSRGPLVTAPAEGAWVEREGRRLLSFSSNDYLGLTRHPAVRAAAIGAIERYGTGAGASPLVTGYHPLAERFESELAHFKGCEGACVFGAGYLANLGTIGAIVATEDAIFIDRLAHASIWNGARLSGAHVEAFEHNDLEDLTRRLRERRAGARYALVLTEGVFSMDGDVAPLPDLAELAARYDAWLLVDDAHGLGTRGRGVGSTNAFDAPLAIDVQVGTLSKALGSYGGFACGSRALVALLRNRARSFIYSTAPPPSAVAAALAALQIVAAQPELAAVPLARARSFARATGLPEPASHIVPLVIGAADAALAASAQLEARGILVTAIRPPSVPEKTARLRCSFTASHTEDDVALVVAAVRELGLVAR
jgi:8-amino-7-oxononanoate synthase